MYCSHKYCSSRMADRRLWSSVIKEQCSEQVTQSVLIWVSYLKRGWFNWITCQDFLNSSNMKTWHRLGRVHSLESWQKGSTHHLRHQISISCTMPVNELLLEQNDKEQTNIHNVIKSFFLASKMLFSIAMNLDKKAFKKLSGQSRLPQLFGKCRLSGSPYYKSTWATHLNWMLCVSALGKSPLHCEC